LLRGPQGIAFQPGAIAAKENPDRFAPPGQNPRRDEPVAAVIARPCDHEDARGERKTIRHRIGHGAAGILHQDRARNAARDREPVGLSHLVRGEKLDHASVTLMGPDAADNAACARTDRGSRFPAHALCKQKQQNAYKLCRVCRQIELTPIKLLI
jgi:hypothetical protein